jgi:uncharacterized membrane protein YkoI
MHCAHRFVLAVLAIFALASAGAAEPGHRTTTETRGVAARAAAAHACLDQKERRAEIESGRVIHLAAAIHAATSRMPGTVVRARLCHGHNGLVYVLTVLARDGKVARLTVDAVRGTLLGGL